MANATDVYITSLQGTDPQNLLPYMTRQHIYESRFWKETCFGLTVTTVLSQAAQLVQCVGSTFGPNQQPTKFICLVLKLLQLQPELEVIVEGFIQQEEFKYVRALGCYYLRLMVAQSSVVRPYQVMQQLEPLYRDYRKLRMRLSTSWTLVTMDEYVHQLLTQETCCGLTLPRLPLRQVLVQQGYLEDDMRRSALQDVILEFQKKNNKTMMVEEEDPEEEEEDDDPVLTEQGLMAYLQHKAEQQQCTAAKVLLARRLLKKQDAFAQQNDRRHNDIHENQTPLDDDDDDDEDRDRDADMRDIKNEQGRLAHRQGDKAEETEEHAKIIRHATINSRETTQATTTTTTTASSTQLQQPPRRNYDNLFKTSKRKSSKSTTATSVMASTAATMNAAPDEHDEAYWNEQRASLGLKPLNKK